MAKRIYSIDTMRIIAMGFVVLLHTEPFERMGRYGNLVNFLIDSSARFAVPFFFLTAGYLFAYKISRRDPTTYLFKRVLSLSSIYVFGLLVSLPVFFAKSIVRAAINNQDIIPVIISKAAGVISPLALLYYGDSVFGVLWFIPALIFSFIFVYLFIVADKGRYVVPVSLGFHIIGLLGESYTMFIDIPFPVRDALFFGFFYTSLGYYIYVHDWQPTTERSLFYLGAIVFFGVVNIGERYILGYVVPGKTFLQGVYDPDYTIATVLLSLSVFIFLLSRPRLGKSTPVPSWGKYAVGIYVVHPPVLYVLQAGGKVLSLIGYEIRPTIFWHLALPPATVIGAVLIYVTAHKLGLIEIGGIHLPRPRQIRTHLSRLQQLRTHDSQ